MPLARAGTCFAQNRASRRRSLSHLQQSRVHERIGDASITPAAGAGRSLRHELDRPLSPSSRPARYPRRGSRAGAQRGTRSEIRHDQGCDRSPGRVATLPLPRTSSALAPRSRGWSDCCSTQMGTCARLGHRRKQGRHAGVYGPAVAYAGPGVEPRVWRRAGRWELGLTRLLRCRCDTQLGVLRDDRDRSGPAAPVVGARTAAVSDGSSSVGRLSRHDAEFLFSRIPGVHWRQARSAPRPALITHAAEARGTSRPPFVAIASAWLRPTG